MVDLKELGEGVSLGGVYTLEHWIREDGAGAFCAASTGSGERVLIKLMPAQAPGAEQQAETWQRLRRLRHAHLLEVRDVGRGALVGKSYIYGVFENPDDVLASALEHGPLSEAEAQGVLEAALDALRYLHGEGAIHGAVDAEHVLAVGETVKLATDTARWTIGTVAQAEDMRQLGDLVRKLRAPEPLSEALEGILLEAAATAAVSGVAPTVRIEKAETSSLKEFPKWIVAVVALAALAILWVTLRTTPGAAPAAPAAVVPAAAPAVRTPAAPPPVQAKPKASSLGRWRVIAFTFRSEEIASRKAKYLNEKWPGFGAVVFAPRDSRGYYLVALGEGMTRDEAAQLQSKARSQGLPQDTYVQNYRE